MNKIFLYLSKIKKSRGPNFKDQRGMTLIEVLVAFFVLAIITLAMVQSVSLANKAMLTNKSKTKAISLIENEVEEARLMSYSEVGISGGNPDGEMEPQSTIEVDGEEFVITRSVNWVEGEYSYKQVEISAQCDKLNNEITVVTQIAPTFGEGGPPSAEHPPPTDLVIDYDIKLIFIRSIGLNWEEPDTETDIDYYNVYREKGDGGYGDPHAKAYVSRYDETFFEFGTGVYSYYVKAVYTDGEESEPSNEVTTTR
ncbi:MAG: prepilin-type N-terminal cleavage/methylation domain-containing protein [Actinomycetota bacterium]|nr:prepilin-type N-terminal cleavage/methylation domain-containing protein [Actinomycetota bacterium]